MASTSRPPLVRQIADGLPAIATVEWPDGRVGTYAVIVRPDGSLALFGSEFTTEEG